MLQWNSYAAYAEIHCSRVNHNRRETARLRQYLGGFAMRTRTVVTWLLLLLGFHLESAATAQDKNRLLGYWASSDINGLYIDIATERKWDTEDLQIRPEKNPQFALINLEGLDIDDIGETIEDDDDYVTVGSSTFPYTDKYYLDSPANLPPEFASVKIDNSQDGDNYLKIIFKKGAFRASSGDIELEIGIEDENIRPSHGTPSLGFVKRFTFFSSGMQDKIGPDAVKDELKPYEPLKMLELEQKLEVLETTPVKTIFELLNRKLAGHEFGFPDYLNLPDSVTIQNHAEHFNKASTYYHIMEELYSLPRLKFTVKEAYGPHRTLVHVSVASEFPTAVQSENMEDLVDLRNCNFNGDWEAGTELGTALIRLFKSNCLCVLPGDCKKANYKLSVPRQLSMKIASGTDYRNRISNLYEFLRILSIEQGLEYAVSLDPEGGKLITVTSRPAPVETKLAYPRIYRLHYARVDDVKKVIDSVTEHVLFQGIVFDSTAPESNSQIEALQREVEFLRDRTIHGREHGHDREGTVKRVDFEDVEALTFGIKDSAFDLKQNLLNVATDEVLVITATEEQHVMLERLIREVDRQPSKVELEVVVCEVSETAARALGVRPGTDSTIISITEQANQGDSFEALSLGSFYRDNGLKFSAVLDHMVKEGHARLLARPTLSTVEGITAKYFVGDYVPIKSSAQTALRFNDEVTLSELAFIPVGIELKFLPRLGRHGDLSIGVMPSVTRFRDEGRDGEADYIDLGGDFKAPQLQVRELSTTANVMADEPFVLAGMISEQDRMDIHKVPLLGDLPLAGKLFRSKDFRRTTTEICIFVVPRVIDSNCPYCKCLDCVCGTEFR
jgi:hypothetical protein